MGKINRNSSTRDHDKRNVLKYRRRNYMKRAIDRFRRNFDVCISGRNIDNISLNKSNCLSPIIVRNESRGVEEDGNENVVVETCNMEDENDDHDVCVESTTRNLDEEGPCSSTEIRSIDEQKVEELVFHTEPQMNNSPRRIGGRNRDIRLFFQQINNNINLRIEKKEINLEPKLTEVERSERSVKKQTTLASKIKKWFRSRRFPKHNANVSFSMSFDERKARKNANDDKDEEDSYEISCLHEEHEHGNSDDIFKNFVNSLTLGKVKVSDSGITTAESTTSEGSPISIGNVNPDNFPIRNSIEICNVEIDKNKDENVSEIETKMEKLNLHESQIVNSIKKNENDGSNDDHDLIEKSSCKLVNDDNDADDVHDDKNKADISSGNKEKEKSISPGKENVTNYDSLTIETSKISNKSQEKNKASLNFKDVSLLKSSFRYSANVFDKSVLGVAEWANKSYLIKKAPITSTFKEDSFIINYLNDNKCVGKRIREIESNNNNNKKTIINSELVNVGGLVNNFECKSKTVIENEENKNNNKGMENGNKKSSTNYVWRKDIDGENKENDMTTSEHIERRSIINSINSEDDLPSTIYNENDVTNRELNDISNIIANDQNNSPHLIDFNSRRTTRSSSRIEDRPSTSRNTAHNAENAHNPNDAVQNPIIETQPPLEEDEGNICTCKSKNKFVVLDLYGGKKVEIKKPKPKPKLSTRIKNLFQLKRRSKNRRRKPAIYTLKGLKYFFNKLSLDRSNKKKAITTLVPLPENERKNETEAEFKLRAKRQLHVIEMLQRANDTIYSDGSFSITESFLKIRSLIRDDYHVNENDRCLLCSKKGAAASTSVLVEEEEVSDGEPVPGTSAENN